AAGAASGWRGTRSVTTPPGRSGRRFARRSVPSHRSGPARPCAAAATPPTRARRRRPAVWPIPQRVRPACSARSDHHARSLLSFKGIQGRAGVRDVRHPLFGPRSGGSANGAFGAPLLAHASDRTVQLPHAGNGCRGGRLWGFGVQDPGESDCEADVSSGSVAPEDRGFGDRRELLAEFVSLDTSLTGSVKPVLGGCDVLLHACGGRYLRLGHASHSTVLSPAIWHVIESRHGQLGLRAGGTPDPPCTYPVAHDFRGTPPDPRRLRARLRPASGVPHTGPRRQ